MPQTQTYLVSKTTPTDSQVEAVFEATGHQPTIFVGETEDAFLRALRGLSGAGGTVVLWDKGRPTAEEEKAILGFLRAGVYEEPKQEILVMRED